MEPTQVYSVSDFQAVCNQILDNAFTGVVIEGEVASFKINQGKFVFFDLKDDQSSIGCFMMKFALRFPLEDGMKVRVRATPKLTNWGKFSLTVQAIMSSPALWMCIFTPSAATMPCMESPPSALWPGIFAQRALLPSAPPP